MKYLFISIRLTKTRTLRKAKYWRGCAKQKLLHTTGGTIDW